MSNDKLIEKIVFDHGWATGEHGHKDDVVFISSLPHIIDLVLNSTEAKEFFKRDAPCAYACEKQAIKLDMRAKVIGAVKSTFLDGDVQQIVIEAIKGACDE